MKDAIKRRGLLKTSLAGVAVAATAAPLAVHAQSPAVTWRMQALWDGGTTPQKYEERFVARVAELTGGRFKINLFAAGQIVPAAQAFDAVRGGAFEMMKTFDGYEAGKIPSFAFTSTIPFGFAESDEYEAWFYERGGLDLVRQAYAPAGLHYIAPTVYGQEPLHSKVPIRKIADLAGKKGRFVGLASTVMGAMGVSVTPLPTGEVYSALDKGVVDMADRGDLTANFEAGLAEVAKFVIVPGFHQPTTATAYVANRGAHDRLPADLPLLAAEPGSRLAIVDPATGQPYGYAALGAREYQLCARFDTDTAATMEPPVAWAPGDWNHAIGTHCFKRSVAVPVK